MNLPVRVGVSRQNTKLPSTMPFYVNCHYKGLHGLGMGLPSSNNLIKKISASVCHILGFC